jgi:hypothetical protein
VNLCFNLAAAASRADKEPIDGLPDIPEGWAESRNQGVHVQVAPMAAAAAHGVKAVAVRDQVAQRFDVDWLP